MLAQQPNPPKGDTTVPAIPLAARAGPLAVQPAVEIAGTHAHQAAAVAFQKPAAPIAAASPPMIVQPERERPWALYPMIGAVAGGVGLQLHYFSYCTRDVDDGCMGGLAPLGFGAAAGAVLGGVLELGHRLVESVRRAP